MTGEIIDGKIVFEHYVGYIKLTTDTEYDKISIDINYDTDEGISITTYSLIPATAGGKIATGTYYIVADVQSNSGFTLKFEKDGAIYTKSTTKQILLYYGIIRNIGLIKFADLTLLGSNLSSAGTANSYIVSAPGYYIFKAVKGKISESVGEMASVEVLWETFGTATVPSVGDLVKNVSYKNSYITFDATDKKGNALIAAKDAGGKILWSWHIWMTDQPTEQVYYNNVGTMMDRNLGATSATPGDVEALGLLYQWGRKDPFLGSTSINSGVRAASTTTWPGVVSSTASNGTIQYAIEHPMTFITGNSNNKDWCYSENDSNDNTRWQSTKTIYDPCPVGYRVPDGGYWGSYYGIWSGAVNTYKLFEYAWNETNKGMDFTNRFGAASSIWYPMTGILEIGSGGLNNVGNEGCYWSATPYYYNKVTSLYIYFSQYTSPNSGVCPSYSFNYAFGQSIRCLKETAN